MINKTQNSYDTLKRILDVITSGILLVLTFPIQVLVFLLVFINLGKPIFYRQKRPGKNQKTFTLIKFRSMKTLDSANSNVKDSQRLTKFGRFIRATSLDELPSLWNVLRGDMSIVGPRPLLIEYLDFYTPEQARRHQVRPGITGLAQINGRNNITWEEKFNFDVQYINQRSLWLDTKIVWQTIGVVLRRKGISDKELIKFGVANDK